MIRSVTIASLVAVLVLVLYLPAGHGPERFLEQVRTDHRAVTVYWGDDDALRILERAMGWQRSVQHVPPIPHADDAPSPQGAGRAVAQEMASVNKRLFDSPYFRSLDAIVWLATYRVTLASAWMPWLLALPLALLLDALGLRRVKALEFRAHEPELFALLVSAAILCACATLILLVLPITLHPAVLPCAPVLALSLCARAVADFHARA